MHATTHLLGGWHATFHTSIACEFSDKECDCHTPLFFICQSLKMYPTFWQTFVYKMYTTFQQTFAYILCTKFRWQFFLFCIQNVAAQKFIKIQYTFCIHFVYILYTSVVYLLCNFCIQNVYIVSMWVINNKTFSIKKYLSIQSMISSSSKKSKPL